MQVAGAAGAAQTVDFASTTAALDLATPSGFASTIAGFVHGDKIDLLATPVTGLVYQGRSLTLQNGASTVAVLHFSGSYTQSDFTTKSDGAGGTLILHT